MFTFESGRFDILGMQAKSSTALLGWHHERRAAAQLVAQSSFSARASSPNCLGEQK